MSTALDLIKGSLRKIGALATGENLSAEEGTDALSALNRMLDSWSTQKLLVFGVTIESFSLISGQNSYTIGNGGDFNTEVPIYTDAAFIKVSGGSSEYPLRVYDNYKWGSIQLKETSSDIPQVVYIEHSHPLRKVYVYPTPSVAATLILHNYRQISSISSLSASLSLPKGYEEAMEYNLSKKIAPEYGLSVSAEVDAIARKSLANIKRVNVKPREVRVDCALTNSNKGNWDYRVGE